MKGFPISDAPGLVGDQTLCAFSDPYHGNGVTVNDIYNPYGDGAQGPWTLEALVYPIEWNNIDRGIVWWNDTPDQSGEGLIVSINGHTPCSVSFELGSGGVSFTLPSPPTNVPLYIAAAYDPVTGDAWLWYWDATNGLVDGMTSGNAYTPATRAYLELSGPGNATYGDGYNLGGYYSSAAIYESVLTLDQVQQNISNIPNGPYNTALVNIPAALSIEGAILTLLPADATLPYDETQVYTIRRSLGGVVTIPTGMFTTSAGTMNPAGVTSSGEATLIPDHKIGTFEVGFVEMD
jgi:hypothetical protein